MKRAGRVEWGRAARSTKKKSSPLEPGKVIINEFPSNSQPTYAIHSRQNYNTQKTPYLRSGMSDTSGERRWRTQAKLELGYCNIPSRERGQTGKKADHIGDLDLSGKRVWLVSFHCDYLPNLLCLPEIRKYFVRFLQSASQVGLWSSSFQSGSFFSFRLFFLEVSIKKGPTSNGRFIICTRFNTQLFSPISWDAYRFDTIS